MNLIPIRGNIIVKLIKEENKDGIVLPDAVERGGNKKFEVVAIGPSFYEDGTLTSPAVVVGDKIYHNHYNTDVLKHEGEEYFVIKESDILAIIR